MLLLSIGKPESANCPNDMYLKCSGHPPSRFSRLKSNCWHHSLRHCAVPVPEMTSFLISAALTSDAQLADFFSRRSQVTYISSYTSSFRHPRRYPQNEPLTATCFLNETPISTNNWRVSSWDLTYVPSLPWQHDRFTMCGPVQLSRIYIRDNSTGSHTENNTGTETSERKLTASEV